MEFSIPSQLLLVIASALVLLSALAIRISRDTRTIHQVNQLNRHLIKAGRARLNTGITVVIELTRKAETIIPLLDHLVDQSYKKQEVIIVVKQTAGKNARTVLAAYRRTHPGFALRIVTFKAGMTLPIIIQRFATQPLVLAMSSDLRLSKRFFSQISVDYALDHPDYIIPRRYSKLDNRIISAFASHALTMIKKEDALSNLQIIPGVIYKRASILREPKITKTFYSTSAYVLLPTPSINTSFRKDLSHLHLNIVIRFAIPAVVVALVYAYLNLQASDTLLLVALLVLTYTFMYATNLIGIKAYSLLDKVSLVLLSPLFMLFQALAYICSSINSFIAAFKWISFKRLPRKKHA